MRPLILALALLAAPAAAQESVHAGHGATTQEVPEGPLTMINGHIPPGLPAPMIDVFTMIDTIDAHGQRLVVTKGIRRAGTRAGIHIHGHGGHTCVLSGVITDFIEGKSPKLYPAGTCYYMPPKVAMTAANLGSEDAVLIDTFVVPRNDPTIEILEPGYPGYEE